MKLNSIHHLSGKIVLLSGLHIGAGDTEIHIGGIDNSVIKNPHTNLPYIPGSSLKGKIRSLLEWRSGAVQAAPLSHNEYQNAANNPQQQKQIETILKLFGNSADNKDKDLAASIGHTRAAFWDCPLNPEFIANIRENGLPFTEAKSENSINRIAGTAENPRQTERVPEGSVFDFRLTLKQFDGDGEELLTTLLKGLKLLELDSLGGNGSRGYGKIKFSDLTIDGNPYPKFETLDPFEA